MQALGHMTKQMIGDYCVRKYMEDRGFKLGPNPNIDYLLQRRRKGIWIEILSISPKVSFFRSYSEIEECIVDEIVGDNKFLADNRQNLIITWPLEDQIFAHVSVIRSVQSSEVN